MPATGYRRALGQHFLRDASIAGKIADTALELALEHGAKSLLEIGPGKGAITRPILMGLDKIDAARKPALIIAERDKEFVEHWKSVGLEVHGGDFLDLPENEWLNRPPLAVASNLPYSAGTAIVTRLARHPDKIPCMVLMFQAEVAYRLRAEPETKDWGSLSVWIQNRWDVKKLVHVAPGAFSPPPEVQSEVVTLIRRAQPRVAVQDEVTWEKLLKACFAHRRKMLRAGLKGQEKFLAALKRSGIDETKRAEALTWEEWGLLIGAVE